MFEVLKKHGIHYFFYIGGNDSSDTLRIINEQAEQVDYPLRCVHIPKTIDNDLVENDHTPGFGSAAREHASAARDLDLLLVMQDDADRFDVAYRAYRCLRGLGCAKDIVVALESEVTALKDNPSLVIHTALTEGKEVYHAA